MKIVDLHTHSNISDGSYTPAELIQLARQSGLSGLALTDHETIAGTAEAKAEAGRLGIDFLMGMEMTVSFQSRRLHIVALGFDEKHPAFQQVYQKIRAAKESRMEMVIDKIRGQGEDISLEKVRPFINNEKIDRYAIMRYFVSLNLFDDVQNIWDIFLNPALAGLNWDIPAEEGLAAIKAAGGVSSLAHFHKRIGLRGMTRGEQEQAICDLTKMGLNGMEGFYPSYSDEDEIFVAQMIDQYGLLPTGGSDFHGKNRPKVKLGTGIDNNIAVPYSIYENVVAHCQRSG